MQHLMFYKMASLTCPYCSRQSNVYAIKYAEKEISHILVACIECIKEKTGIDVKTK